MFKSYTIVKLLIVFAILFTIAVLIKDKDPLIFAFTSFSIVIYADIIDKLNQIINKG